MSGDMLRIVMIVLALVLTLPAVRADAGAFERFRSQAAAAVAARLPGADGARLTFTNPAVAEGAATLYGPDTRLTVERADAAACRFALRVESASGPALPPALLTGTCVATARVPAMTRAIRPGEAIAAADIQTIEEPLARLAPGVVRRAEALAGMTPRTMLAAGRPVQESALRRMPVVTKGQAVTLSFRAGGLELTAAGQALTDAAAGEPVSVLNLRSRRTVEAVADGPGQVSVPAQAPSGAPRLAAAAP
jgi:flagella basal body P-ring formation protein FlgA